MDRNKEDMTMSRSAIVALLAEGVDRNTISSIKRIETVWSPSLRRAWIEMFSFSCWIHPGGVALLAEGVDRNFMLAMSVV